MLPFIPVLGRPLPTYGLVAVLGILAALLYCTLTNRGGKAGHIPPVDVPHLLVLAVLGALAGAKALSLLTQLPAIVRNWGRLMADPRLFLFLLTHGLVFYGGLFGGLLAVYLYCKKYALPLGAVLGVCTPAIPLFHVFGRIGCFLAGCCWGVPVSWGISYTLSPQAPNGVPLLPVQLIEAACNLLLFVALAILSRRLVQKWMVLPIYLIAYGTLRFCLEFFRGDVLRGVFILSTSQWISLAVVAGTLVYLWRRHTRPTESQ